MLVNKPKFKLIYFWLFSTVVVFFTYRYFHSKSKHEIWAESQRLIQSQNSLLNTTNLTEKEFVLLFARQRSGSTTLAMGIGSSLAPCTFSLNEPFNDRMYNHGSGFNEQYFYLWDFYNNKDTHTSPLAYLKSQRDIMCNLRIEQLPKEMLTNSFYKVEDEDKEKTLHEFCIEKKTSCSAVAKIFDIPNWHQMEKTHRNYESLIEMIKLENAVSVVLERNAADEECSYRWGHTARDWGYLPETHQHTEARKKFYDSCPKEASVSFQEKHDNWFNQIRALHHSNAKVFLDVPFDVHLDPNKEQNVYRIVADAVKL